MSIGHPNITSSNIIGLKVSNWTKKIGTRVVDLGIWDRTLTAEEMVSWTTCRSGSNKTRNNRNIYEEYLNLSGSIILPTYSH